MRKCTNISPYMRRLLVIYDFATAPFWIFVYMRKIIFSFLSVYSRTVFRKYSSTMSYLRVRTKQKRGCLWCTFSCIAIGWKHGEQRTAGLYSLWVCGHVSVRVPMTFYHRYSHWSVYESTQDQYSKNFIMKQ